MGAKKLQNKIVESSLLLPITISYTFVLSILGGFIYQGEYTEFFIVIITAFVLFIFNNTNSLIRVYSHIIPCFFLTFSIIITPLLVSSKSAVLMLCFALFFLLIFQAYQNSEATYWIFYAFASIGISSIYFVKVLFFIPILWIILFTKVLVANSKSFVASILGIIFPYWIAHVYYSYTNNNSIETLIEHFDSLIRFEGLANFNIINISDTVTIIYLLILSIISGINYIKNNLDDKIKTRMIYEAFILCNTSCFFFIILQPQYYKELMAILVTTSSPLIAHHITLAKTKASNLAFIAILLITISITVFNIYNLWIPLYTFL